MDDIWEYSEFLFDDAVRCNVGEEPCTTVDKFNLVNVPITDEDLQIVSDAVRDVSFPAWAEICDKSNPGCSEAWKATVGKAAGLQF